MKMYFNKQYLETIQTKNKTFNLNVTYGVYESNSLDFYKLCKNHNYAPEENITELDYLGAPIDIKQMHYVIN